MTACAKREEALPPDAPEEEVPPGHVRLRSGQVVTEELAAQVLPAARVAEASQRVRKERSGPALHPPPCTCARGEVAQLLAALAEEREARLAAERARAFAEGVVEGHRQALAQVLEARAAVSPAAVPLHVPPTAGDMSPPVPRGQGDMKGGRGVAAATTKSELLREREKLKKRRQRARKAAAERAREASPVPSVSPGTCPPAVPPWDTSRPARPPVPPTVRRARPAWMEDSALGPEKLFYAWCQEERLKAFPQALAERPPAEWGAWYQAALAEVGGDEGRLRAAWVAYLGEDWARSRKPVCPVKAFISPDRGVWRRHVPGQDVPADGALPPATPVDARRRAALEVGRGEEPPRVACATGCGEVSCQLVWGHPLAARCLARVEAEVALWTEESVTAWVRTAQARHAQFHARI